MEKKMVELEIISKKENPLLKRIEARFSVAHAGRPTPTKKDVTHALSEEFSTKPELVVVDGYWTKSAGLAAKGVARIYQDKQSLETAEIRKSGAKNKKGKPAEAAAAPKK